MGQVQTKVADTNGAIKGGPTTPKSREETFEVDPDDDSPLLPAVLQPYYHKLLECPGATEEQFRDKQVQVQDCITHLKQLDKEQVQEYAKQCQTKVINLSQQAMQELQTKATKARKAADLDTLVHVVIADPNYRSPVFFPPAKEEASYY